MTTIGATQPKSYISPANERMYHQSNLLGTWSGTFSKTNQAVTFKVVSINGSTAQVEYTHNGHTERGTGSVDGMTVTFGNVTIGTRDGTSAAMEFSYGIAKQTATLTKAADTTPQNQLVGSWIGSNADHGVTFKVVSINGRDAQVQFTVDSNTAIQATGDLSKNTVMIKGAQVTSTDGVTGTVVFKIGSKTLSMPVKKFTPKTASSSSSSSTVNITA